MKLFSVYDSKSETYCAPIMSINSGHFCRFFQEMVNRSEDSQYSMWHKFPGDFTAFEIGDFDQLKGAATSYTALVNLGTALSFLNKPVEQLPLIPPVSRSDARLNGVKNADRPM